MLSLKGFNVALRGIMEAGIIFGLGYWGYQTGQDLEAKLLLSTAAPLLLFGFWGFYDFHKAGRNAELWRLLQELLISGMAAVALYMAGQHVFCWVLAGISIMHHALVYLLGGSLLK